MSRAQQIKALEKAFRVAERLPFVTGVDFGMAKKGGRSIRRLAIRFYVEEKLAIEALDPRYILPRSIDGIRCDVIKAKFVLHSVPNHYSDYLQPGLSIGNAVRGTTGSVGPCVVDNVTGRIGFVSCWHVMCGGLNAAKHEEILQPGFQHQTYLVPRVSAFLERYTSLGDGYDAALALLSDDSQFDTMPWGLSSPVVGVERPKRNMQVYKVGAGTGFTEGYISSEINGEFDMNLSHYGAGGRRYKGFVVSLNNGSEYKEVSSGGDSGALWINAATGKAVGLNFGGVDGVTQSAEYALSHQLIDVLSRLNVSLYFGDLK
ncbi:hypothetical protein Q7F05_00415 [Pseudomonas sp. Lb2C1-1]|uniref:hypothetical protein n=1 Tax=Pseudomonas TaxID=286 RepID=UPI003919BB0B